VPSDAVFVLDANVFIEAARRYYAFDLVPAFWEKLAEHAAGGRIESIDRVQSELERGHDELAEWVDGPFAGAFASTAGEDIVDAYREVVRWVEGQGQFLPAAKAEFAAGADGWLVAYAIVKQRVVVTHEVVAPDVRRRVPIPNVCEAFELPPCIDTFQMLRVLGVRLG
jgi:hypothetical protein